MSTKAMLFTSFAVAVIFLTIALLTRGMGHSSERQGNAFFLMSYALFFPLLLALPSKRRCCFKRS